MKGLVGIGIDNDHVVIAWYNGHVCLNINITDISNIYRWDSLDPYHLTT